MDDLEQIQALFDAHPELFEERSDGTFQVIPGAEASLALPDFFKNSSFELPQFDVRNLMSPETRAVAKLRGWVAAKEASLAVEEADHRAITGAAVYTDAGVKLQRVYAQQALLREIHEVFLD